MSRNGFSIAISEGKVRSRSMVSGRHFVRSCLCSRGRSRTDTKLRVNTALPFDPKRCDLAILRKKINFLACARAEWHDKRARSMNKHKIDVCERHIASLTRKIDLYSRTYQRRLSMSRVAA